MERTTKEPKRRKQEYRIKRIGRCNPKACGAFCCRMGPLMKAINLKDKKSIKWNKDEVRFYEFFGMRKIDEIDGDAIYGNMQACIHLKCNRCSIHDKRPELCKAFPQDPNQTWYKLAKKHGCTYKFIKVPAKRRKKQCKK